MVRNIERAKDGMNTLIDDARDAVVGGTYRAERGAESAVESANESVHAAGETVREQARTAARGARRRLERAAEVVDRGYTRARNDLSRAATATTEYLTENPGLTLLLAVSAGFMLGLLTRRQLRPA